MKKKSLWMIGLGLAALVGGLVFVATPDASARPSEGIWYCEFYWDSRTVVGPDGNLLCSGYGLGCHNCYCIIQGQPHPEC